jgi:endonuclease-3
VESRAKVRAIHKILLKAYGEPERSQMDAVSELVCTILSQNTNDANRDRAYTSLRGKFPTWEHVRDAPTRQVVAAIRPAGLANQKGPRIQRVLRRIAETDPQGRLDIDFLADLPVEEAKQWLMSLDGVGPKTAAIVLLFSLNRPAFPVDTHIHRVTTRLGLIPPGTTAEKAHGLLEALVPTEWYYPFHLNVIAHGRAVCKAHKPRCDICPLQKYCDYWDTSNVKPYTRGDKR